MNFPRLIDLAESTYEHHPLTPLFEWIRSLL